jgi:hypothetical protein
MHSDLWAGVLAWFWAQETALGRFGIFVSVCLALMAIVIISSFFALSRAHRNIRSELKQLRGEIRSVQSERERAMLRHLHGTARVQAPLAENAEQRV